MPTKIQAAVSRLFGVVRVLLGIAPCLALGLVITSASSHAAPRLLQEPNFDGLFSIPEVGRAPVLRDEERGWTYFRDPGSVEGVAVEQSLFRVNDAGIADLNWRLPRGFQITAQYLAPDATPIVLAYLPGNGPQPNYEQAWFRLPRDSSGDVKPIKIEQAYEMPPRDHAAAGELGASGERRLPMQDGSAIVLEEIAGASPSAPWSTRLRKVDRNNVGLWSYLEADHVSHLAVDRHGRVYYIAREPLVPDPLLIGTEKAKLVRLDANGAVDTSWNPTLDLPAAFRVIHMRSVGERLIVAGSVSGTNRALSGYRIVSLDLNGGAQRSTRDTPYPIGGITKSGTVLSAHAGARSALIEANDSSIPARISSSCIGYRTAANAIVKWGEHYVIGGSFSYWFEGRQYQNLFRVDHNLRPDPTWRPTVDGGVGALTVDRDGRLLVASNSASGIEGRLLRYLASGAKDERWQPQISGDMYALLAMSDGSLYVGGAFSAVDGVPSNSIVRFGSDDTFDRHWGSGLSGFVFQRANTGQFGRDGVFSLFDAGSGGIYAGWEIGGMNSWDSGTLRFAAGGNGDMLPAERSLSALTKDALTGYVYAIADAWDISNAQQGGFALVRMRPPDMKVDTQWTNFLGRSPPVQGIGRQTETHLDLCGAFGDADARRFSKATGRQESHWLNQHDIFCGARFVDHTADGAIVGGFGAALSRYSKSAIDESTVVVEFYIPTAKRYFITGRDNEIRLLDSMPQSFVRTGMSFLAETARLNVPDEVRAPVCRYYSPPELGGSNTHFYGRGRECQLLQPFTQFRFEGYDFRVTVPNEFNQCPSTSVIAVHRFFNQRIADNEGNHRYVVGALQRERMLQTGWIDEGIAFCTSNATEAIY